MPLRRMTKHSSRLRERNGSREMKGRMISLTRELAAAVKEAAKLGGGQAWIRVRTSLSLT